MMDARRIETARASCAGIRRQLRPLHQRRPEPRRPRKSPANISMTRKARRCSTPSAPCRNITRPAPKWRCCAAMPAKLPP